MKSHLFTKFSLFLISALVTTQNANAYLRSVSAEQEITINGQQGSRIVVTCSNSAQQRVLIRENENSQWCAEINPDYCFNSSAKMKAARKACKTSFKKIETGTNKAKVKPETETTSNSDIDSTTEAPQQDIVDEEIENTPIAVETLSNDQRTVLESEKIQIEEQKLRIDQQKLELRKKELELKKQQLETAQ